MQKVKNKIAIICALSREIEAVKKEFEFTKEIKFLNYKFEIGTINDKELILCQLGIGKVNAAVFTSVLINQFNPDLIINVGIAAGYADYLKTLDDDNVKRGIQKYNENNQARVDISSGELGIGLVATVGTAVGGALYFSGEYQKEKILKEIERRKNNHYNNCEMGE
jgi:hypothetical protein